MKPKIRQHRPSSVEHQLYCLNYAWHLMFWVFNKLHENDKLEGKAHDNQAECFRLKAIQLIEHKTWLQIHQT